MNDYEVYCEETLIGFAKEVDIDFPNMIGRFEPTDAFNTVENLFMKEYEYSRSNPQKWAETKESIFRKGFRLESQNGRLLVGDVSGTLRPGTIAYVHIHGGKIWWRAV